MKKIFKNDFPFLALHPNIIYFDNASTTLKPYNVIKSINDYYFNFNTNIQRGGNTKFSEKLNKLFNLTRKKTAKFINAESSNSIIFTSGATNALNQIAYSLIEKNIKKKDVILLNKLEHSSNLFPWIKFAKNVGAIIEYIPIKKDGLITFKNLKKSLHKKVKIVSMSHISNVFGYINNIKKFSKLIHSYKALFVVDGVQSAGHIPIDVQKLNVDFFIFSSHKMLGPNGVGIIYGKIKLLKKINPLLSGGGSIENFEKKNKIIYKKIPYKFESGTPNIEGILGFSSAIDYIKKIGIYNIKNKIEKLSSLLITELLKIKNIKIYNKLSTTGIVIFSVKNIFVQDVAQYLGSKRVFLRSGEHCAKLLYSDLNFNKTVRISLYFYNTKKEIFKFIKILKKINLKKCIEIFI